MSLIFGVNLSDRVYLSCDTRLTQKNGSNIVDTKDRIIKISPFTADIAAAFAGDARMSVFVLKELARDIKPGLDIRTFRAEVESRLAPIANKYWETVDSEANIAIVFGGLNRNMRKPPFTTKQINELMTKITRGQSINIKPAMFKAMMPDAEPSTRISDPVDTHVFSVQIFPPNGFVVQDADWGEYLAYGPKGITKETLDPATAAKVEFSEEADNGNTVISAIMADVVQRTQEPTIGGAFFNFVLSEEITGVVLGRIYRANMETKQVRIFSEISEKEGRLYGTSDGGEPQPLTLLHQYNDFGSLDL